MRTKSSRSARERKYLDKVISAARGEAREAADKGIRWRIGIRKPDGTEAMVNVSTLAYIKPERAAERWIGRCTRLVRRLHPELSKGRVRRELWAFWRGE